MPLADQIAKSLGKPVGNSARFPWGTPHFTVGQSLAAIRCVPPGGYGETGFQASYVIFPTPGCWEVTGRVADASVTFVTRVVKVGDGPSWRRGM